MIEKNQLVREVENILFDHFLLSANLQLPIHDIKLNQTSAN